MYSSSALRLYFQTGRRVEQMPATVSDKECVQPASNVHSCDANDERPVELIRAGKCNRSCKREQLK